MIKEAGKHTTKWTITKFEDEAHFAQGDSYETRVINGNVLLNEGITLMLNLLAGLGGTAFSNAATYLGVGESTTAAAASQTGLSGATKTYKAMEATYPQVSGQTITFRSVFGSTDANNVWQEFTVVNASSDTGTNLNRKVDNQGTKVAGQVWTLDLAITFA